MPRKLILAHDLGTSGDKAVLVGLEDGVVGSSFAPYATRYPVATWAEQDPEDWWKAVCATTKEIIRKHRLSPRDIAVVTFSGQMMGCLPVAQDGTPLRHAIIWADQRAVAEAGEMVERAGGLASAYQIAGHRISPAYSAPKMMWLKRHSNEVFSGTHKFLQAKDFVVHRLTGAWATDYSDACGTGLFDLARRTWSEVLVQAADLDMDKLPVVVPSTSVVGEVNGAAAKATGLVRGTPVVIGGGDGVCATAGAGVVREGIAYVYLGSSAWVATASGIPVRDPHLRTFTWIHVVPELYSPNGTMHNAGSSVEWVRELFGIEDYAGGDEEVKACAPGAGGLLFLPYLMGERSPRWNPHARGAFIGLTKKHARPHLVRAVYEGVAFNLRLISEALQAQGLPIARLRLVGGGAQSPAWRRILTDVLGQPLEVLSHPLEATAIGAAMAGAVGVGLVSNLEEASMHLVRIADTETPVRVGVYQELYAVFVQAYDRVVPVFDALARIQKGLE